MKNQSTNLANIGIDSSFFKTRKLIIFDCYLLEKSNRNLRFLMNAFIEISDNRTKSPTPISGPSCSIEPAAI
jgi:hypothetical protein